MIDADYRLTELLCRTLYLLDTGITDKKVPICTTLYLLRYWYYRQESALCLCL